MILDRYDRAFAHGKLQPEARMLRLEALIAMGRLDEAKARARQALARGSSGPYTARLQQVAKLGAKDEFEITSPDAGHRLDRK